jgi:hypothetical protein
MPRRLLATMALCMSIIVLLGMALLLRTQSPTITPAENGATTIYYTGPMRSKSNPDILVDEEGHVTTRLPSTAIPSASSAAKNGGK